MQQTNNLTDPQLLIHELQSTATQTLETLGVINDLINHLTAPRDPKHPHPCDVCVHLVLDLQHRQTWLERFSSQLIRAINKHYNQKP